MTGFCRYTRDFLGNGYPLLHHLIQSSMVEGVKVLLNQHADVHELSKFGTSAIAIAIEEEHLDILNILLPYVDLTAIFYVWDNAYNRYETNAIEFAQTKGNSKLLEAIYGEAELYDIDIEESKLMNNVSCYPDGIIPAGIRSLLNHVLLLRNNECLEVLLNEECMNPNVCCNCMCDDVPLAVAIREKNVQAVRLILQKGANVEAWVPYNTIYMPVLSVAAEVGNSEIVQLIIQYGSDTEVEDDYERTPLLNASRNLYAKCVKALIDSGCNVHATDYRAANAILTVMGGMRNDHDNNGIQCIKYLKSAGCSLDDFDDYGYFPISEAIRLGRPNVLIELLQAGANPNLITSCSETPLHFATSCLSEDAITFVRILISHGASPNILNFSPLPAVVMNDHCSYEMCKFLVDNNADINGIDLELGTTLLASAIFGKQEIAKFVLRLNAKINIANYSLMDGRYLLEPAINDHEALMIVFAAGEKYTYFNSICPEKPEEMKHSQDDTDLANNCRSYIREKLIQSNPSINLFQLVPHTGLPTILKKYLLFNISLDDI